jgi:hypothetical protein
MIINFLKKIKYKYKISQYPKSNKKFDDETLKISSNLKRDGFYIFKDFDKVNLNAKKLSIFFSNLDKNLVENYVNKKKINAKGKHTYKIFCTELFNKTDLINFGKDDFLLKKIESYFGFEPHLQHISAWIDIPNDEYYEDPISTQLFHRDSDDLKLIKTFFYLTDVKKENGPFEFIKGSHKCPYFIIKNNNESNYNDLVFKKFGADNLVSFQAPKNTLIMADTNGYHRGRKLKKDLRVLITCMYTSFKPNWGKSKNENLFLN